jgi:TPR repeat protein
MTIRSSTSSRHRRSLALSALALGACLALALPVPQTARAQAAPAGKTQTACPDKAAAQKGDAMAEYLTGKAYDDGACGLTTDKREALRWYKAAAVQGDMLAAYETGETYFTGDGVPTDYPKAKQWFLKAAARGHGPSALRLGFLCAEAHYKGVTVDNAAAEHWFTVAAEQDTGDARFRLGTFYLEYKQPRDYAQGVHWLTLAAQGGHTLAMFDLGRFLLAPPADAGMKADRAQGVEWIARAAKGGLLPAQMTLADMYEKGRDVAPDTALAFQWILRIASAPTASAFYLNRAGDAFFSGTDAVPKNYPAARRFYERAARRGDAHALRRLSDIYAQGLGVEKDARKAASYLRRATKAD